MMLGPLLLLPLAPVDVALEKQVAAAVYDAPYPPTCSDCEKLRPAGTPIWGGHYDCSAILGCNQRLCAQCSNEPTCDGDCQTAKDKHGSCYGCLLYTSPSPRDRQKSRMPSSA